MPSTTAQSGVRVQFLGSGDAFGSGGRFQTCIALTSAQRHILLDCGASSLIAMRRFGIDSNAVDAVLITHLHGDHFGGLPFFILDAQLNAKRTAPLQVGGPPGTPERLAQTMEALFPGSTRVQRAFEVQHTTWQPGQRVRVGPAAVTPYPVQHASGAPPFALRVELSGRTVAYSGDTEWVPALADAARDADLFVCESLFYEKTVKFHLDYRTVLAHRAELTPKRMILTHMGAEMLAHAQGLPIETAEDGKVIDV